MTIEDIARARSKRNAELVPDYQYKTMKNGKTFIYYRSCNTPCGVFVDGKLTANNTCVPKSSVKECLLYLQRKGIRN